MRLSAIKPTTLAVQGLLILLFFISNPVNTSAQAPSITGQPSNATICPGSNTTFSVTASNATGYQWQLNSGSGFSDISNGGVYSGATTATLTITGATAGMTGYQYQCVVSGSTLPNATSNTATLTVNNRWVGNINPAWSLGANWACGTLPTATTDVVINSGTTFPPLINITTATCNNLTIASGATLAFSGSTNVLTVKGNITNSGTFNASAGKLVLSGSSQTIPAIAVKNLQLNGSGTKTLSGAASVSGILTFTNGYLALGNNTLTLGAAATTSGSSSSSFIITDGTGALAISNIGTGGRTGAITFPVGNSSSSYTPVTITNSGTADVFGARVISGVYNAYNTSDVPTGAAQTTYNVNKTWLITEGTAGGSNANITFQWNGADEQTSFDRTNCFIGHYTSNTWNPGSTQAASGSDPYTLSVSGITSFSPFGIGSAGSILPLTLRSFTGRMIPDGARLQWQTDNEQHLAYFDIERSNDGSSYAFAGRTPAFNQPGIHDYSFTDKITVSPVLYYRLKQADMDGRFTYSPVVRLSSDNTQEKIAVLAPNPFRNTANLKLSLIAPQQINFTIIDNTGKGIRKGQWSLPAGNTVLPISLEGLAPGLYYLELNGPGFHQLIPMAKQ